MVNETGNAVHPPSTTTPHEDAAADVSWSARAGRLLPRHQMLRYLLIGVWNTVFGYACYAAFVALYSRVLPARYLPLTVDLASVSGTPFGITMSFFCYKFLVFRTTGNHLIEWLRCFAVYGSATIPGLFVLPVLTRFLQGVAPLHQFAPYLAGALVMGGTTIYTYFAHKNFSFSRPRGTAPAEIKI